jgi:hypothetical protein
MRNPTVHKLLGIPTTSACPTCFPATTAATR